MELELAWRIYDEVIPGWREAKLISGNRRMSAPYREDRNPSLDIHEDKGVWCDRATGEGGGAFDLAKRVRGEEDARALVRRLSKNGLASPRGAQPAKQPASSSERVSVVGPPTREQEDWLRAQRRAIKPGTIQRLGIQLVTWRNLDWLGIPCLESGDWKLWGVDRCGEARETADQKLPRINIGSGSVVVSPDLCESTPGPILRLWDVEGESDLIAAVDAGMTRVIAPTTGAVGIAPYRRYETYLAGLGPEEVIVVRDRDEAGRKGAEAVAACWRAKGIPTRVLELPEQVGEGGDLRDYLRGRGPSELDPGVAALGGPADLDALADATPLVSANAPSEAEREENDVRPSRTAVMVSLSTVKSRPVEWLWGYRIPLGKITILDGDPGLGKSLVTLDLAARISTGRELPDGTPGRTGSVLLLSAEDDLSDTIVPRLDAAGADLTRIHALTAIRSEHGDEPLSLSLDLKLLEERILEKEPLLVVVDPLMAYLGSETNSYRDQDVRRLLAPLARVAENSRTAFLIVRHLTKSAGGSNPLYRGGGSIGIIGAARSGLLVAPDPDDEKQRVLAGTKSNLGPPCESLRFCVSVTEQNIPTVQWLGASAHSANDLLIAPEDPETRGQLDEAVEFLRDELSAGPRTARDLRQAATAAGIKTRMLYKAQKRLGVTSRRIGFGKGGSYEWRLPAPA